MSPERLHLWASEPLSQVLEVGNGSALGQSPVAPALVPLHPPGVFPHWYAEGCLQSGVLAWLLPGTSTARMLLYLMAELL